MKVIEKILLAVWVVIIMMIQAVQMVYQCTCYGGLFAAYWGYYTESLVFPVIWLFHLPIAIKFYRRNIF